MAITPTQYNLAPGWVIGDFETALGNALTAAGFTQQYAKGGSYPGVIWSQTWDATKTYGTKHFEIYLNGTAIYFRNFNVFDYATGAVGGDQYFDYYSANINSIDGAWKLCDITTSANAFFRVWVSAVNTSFAVVEFHNAANQFLFWVTPSNATFNNWVDFDIQSYMGIYFPIFTNSGYYTRYTPAQNHLLKRDINCQSIHSFNSSTYFNYFYHSQFVYLFAGNYTSNSTSSHPYSSVSSPWNSNTTPPQFIVAPSYNAQQVPGTVGNYQPLVTGMPYSGYCDGALPSDFGVVPIGNNGLSAGDQFVVTSGVEEYEALYVKNQSSSSDQYTSCAFVARTV